MKKFLTAIIIGATVLTGCSGDPREAQIIEPGYVCSFEYDDLGTVTTEFEFKDDKAVGVKQTTEIKKEDIDIIDRQERLAELNKQIKPLGKEVIRIETDDTSDLAVEILEVDLEALNEADSKLMNAMNLGIFYEKSEEEIEKVFKEAEGSCKVIEKSE